MRWLGVFNLEKNIFLESSWKIVQHMYVSAIKIHDVADTPTVTHSRDTPCLLLLLSFSHLLIHYLWSCSIMTSVVKSILLRTTSRALKWKLQTPHLLRREKVEDDEEEDDDGKFRRSRLMIKTDYVPQIADGGWTSFAFAASNSIRSFFFIRDTKF